METRRAPTATAGMGPLPAAVRKGVGRLSPERRALLESIRASDRPLCLADLVEATGRHENTVREHLAALLRTGLVTRRSRVVTTPGRPAWLYSAAQVTHPAGPSEYAGLASLLAETLASTTPSVDSVAVRAGTTWGRQLAAVDPDPGPHTDGPRDRVVAMLRRFGFEPRRDRHSPQVRLTRCPLLDTARAHPAVVCNVHRGIVGGAIEVFGGSPEGIELAAFAEPGACLLTIPFDRPNLSA